MSIVQDNEVKVSIDNNIKIDKKSGLNSIRLSHTFTSNNKLPNYGIISQEGMIDVYDFYGKINNGINDNSINNGDVVSVDMGKGMSTSRIGEYEISSLQEIGNNNFQINLNDKLLKMQQILIEPIKLAFNGVADMLFQKLEELSGSDFTFICNQTTRNYLYSIKIKYYYLESSSLWSAWQKLCELAQLYIYMQYDGNIRVICQNEINELVGSQYSSAIVIPMTSIVEQPIENRLENTKLDNINSSYNKMIERLDTYVFTSPELKICEEKQLLPNGITNGYDIYSGVSDYYYWTQINCTIDLNTIQNLIRFDALDFYIQRPTPNAIELELNNKNYVYTNSGWSNDTTLNGTEKIKLQYVGNGISGGLIIPYHNFIHSILNDCNIYNASIDNNNILTLRLQFMYRTTLGTSLLANTNYNVYFTQSAKLNLLLPEYYTQQLNIDYGTGNNIFSLPTNELVTNETQINNVPIYEVNALSVIDNYYGFDTMSFRMALDNLYNSNNELQYDINNGELIKLFDVFKITKNYRYNDINYRYNPYGTPTEPKLWYVTKTEFDKTGAKFMNIEAISVKPKLFSLKSPNIFKKYPFVYESVNGDRLCSNKDEIKKSEILIDKNVYINGFVSEYNEITEVILKKDGSEDVKLPLNSQTTFNVDNNTEIVLKGYNPNNGNYTVANTSISRNGFNDGSIYFQDKTGTYNVSAITNIMNNKGINISFKYHNTQYDIDYDYNNYLLGQYGRCNYYGKNGVIVLFDYSLDNDNREIYFSSVNTDLINTPFTINYDYKDFMN